MIDPYLQDILDSPIGGKGLSMNERREAFQRAGSIFLPKGKVDARRLSGEARAAKRAARPVQLDLEDAVEAVGGKRGGCSS